MKMPHCCFFYSTIALQIRLGTKTVWLYKTKPVQGNLELAVFRQLHTPCVQFQLGSRRKSSNVSMNLLQIYWTFVHTRPKQLLRLLVWKAWLSINWKYTLSHLPTHVRNVWNLLGDVSWPIQEIYWAPWEPPTFQRSISAIGRVTGIDKTTWLASEFLFQSRIL